MEERKTVKLKKNEYEVKEYVKKTLGKGKFSRIGIEYTPIGEKIIISTHKPGLIIGRRGEIINELTETLKSKFELENPHIEIEEIKEPEFDSQIIADDLALGLEKVGPLKFKVLAYKALSRIITSGAQGVEIKLSGKLPSSRAKLWRFAQGYLKKTGDAAKVVHRAKSRAETKPGTVGIKVSILSPHAKMKDRIDLNEELIQRLRDNAEKEKNKKKLNK